MPVWAIQKKEMLENMSKFSIDAAHGIYPDTGAEGYLNEQDCSLDIVNKVISKLEALGHTAWNTRPTKASSVTDSLQRRCDAASGTDYLVSIHLNAGKGKGTEVFAMSAAGKALASKVLTNLVALGFVNRGVKDGSGLYVIRHSSPVAILIEVCFVDTQSDADLYNSLGSDKIANAIVQALTGQTVQATTSQTTTQKAPTYDESIPTGPNIFPLGDTGFYIEKRADGDMGVHLDRGNYVTLRKGGAPEVFWNNNKGQGGSKRLF